MLKWILLYGNVVDGVLFQQKPYADGLSTLASVEDKMETSSNAIHELTSFSNLIGPSET